MKFAKIRNEIHKNRTQRKKPAQAPEELIARLSSNVCDIIYINYYI